MDKNLEDVWVTCNIPSADRASFTRIVARQMRISDLAPPLRPRFRDYMTRYRAFLSSLESDRDKRMREIENENRELVDGEFADWRARLWNRARAEGWHAVRRGTRVFIEMNGEPRSRGDIEAWIETAFRDEFDCVISSNERRERREEFQRVCV